MTQKEFEELSTGYSGGLSRARVVERCKYGVVLGSLTNYSTIQVCIRKRFDHRGFTSTMGIAPHSKLLLKSDPKADPTAQFLPQTEVATNKINKKFRALTDKNFEPDGRRGLPLLRYGKRKGSILQQLVLAQDWQRVLIRARLFPYEAREYWTMNFVVMDTTVVTANEITPPKGESKSKVSSTVDADTICLRVLPLHLVCALVPPEPVVRLFLEIFPDAASMPIVCAKTKPLSLQKKPGALVKKAFQFVGRSGSPKEGNVKDEVKIGAGGRGRGRFRLFGSRGRMLANVRNRPLSSNEDEETVFPIQEVVTTFPSLLDERHCLLSTKRHHGKEDSTTVYYSAHGEHEKHRAEQPRQTGNPGDESECTSDDGNCSSEADDSSISSHFSQASWNDERAILQLSPSGGIVPLPLHPSNDTDSTSETSGIGGGKSVMISAEGIFSIKWDMTPLRTLLKGGSFGVTSTTGLLPLHIACLYGASAGVLKELTDTFPIAALSDVLGMLPIHWVAAGWKIPSLLPALPYTGSTIQIEEDTTRLKGPMESLRVLRNLIPETVRVKSGSHCMTPDQYLEECMEEGSYKDECLRILQGGDTEEDGYADDDTRSWSTASCSLLFVDSADDMSSLCFDSTAKKGGRSNASGISGLIAKKDWEGVLHLVEDDPSTAGKWLYGIDENRKSDEAPVVWKRLPIHLACSRPGVPVGILEILAKAYPEGLSSPDQAGCLPLHILCSRGSECRLPSVKLLLDMFSEATMAVDLEGRLPLHAAIVSAVPYTVIEALVERDPTSATVGDVHGMKALDYALQSYGRENMVTELLTMVDLFEKHSKIPTP